MQTLTADGHSRLEQIATQHGVDRDAVETLFDALRRGGGTQAQFSHPALGGMGQWSRGGMIMIGDMFNADLKARVDRLCSELSKLAQDTTLIVDRDEASHSWPDDWGQPSSSGSQNGTRYAYFAGARRLAVESDGCVALYDTADHRISGVSQQNGGTQDLAFTSQHGTIRLHELARIEDDRRAGGEASPSITRREPTRLESGCQDAPSAHRHDDDIFATIERLHELRNKGVLSEADYADKKRELLARI